MMMSKKSDPQTADLSERLLSSGIDIEEQVILDEPVEPADTVQLQTVETGEKQPNSFRDAWAAVLFLGHQVAIFYLALAWGIPSLNFEYQSYNTTDHVHFGGLFFLSLTASLGALTLGAAALYVMMHLAEQLVQFALCFSLICNAILVVFFLIRQYWWGAVIGLFFLLWAGLYARLVWHRIPFAASNLKTALSAVQTNGGLVLVAFGSTMAMTVWSVLWMLAALGVYMKSADCNAQGVCSSHMKAIVGILLLLSYYWTSEVSKNVVHVTTAGVVGTWWFAPDDASRYCSPAITDSLHRASTFSLGSICLGSLLTAVLQVLYQLCREARHRGRCNTIVLCILECLVSFLERLVAYFNKFAYVYIGLYGYDYLSAGQKALNLFAERGWTVIISDSLVLRVLSLMSLVIGALTGCLGIVLASIKPSWVEEFGDSSSIAVAFFIPFLLGTAIALIMMSVVSSAVDTCIVSFAEAPLEFERNHPGLYTQMVSSWRAVYPDEFGM